VCSSDLNLHGGYSALQLDHWLVNAFDPAIFAADIGCLPCCAVCYLDMPTQIIDGTTDPYASEAAAEAAIAAQTPSGCLAEGNPPGIDQTRDVFTSSFSGGVFDVESNWTYDTGALIYNTFFCRVYLSAADGLSIDYDFVSTGGGLPDSAIYVYEDDQTTLVDSSLGLANTTGTFAPTIATDGYYWILCLTSDLDPGPATSEIRISVTGGAALFPCTARALWDDTVDTGSVICV
jgi:hypothetical protein